MQLNQSKIEWFYYTLDNKVYKLKIASNETDQLKGLSGIKTKPDSYDGMLFVFKDKKIRAMHNKNVHVDLDILWVNDFKIVGQDELLAYSKTGLQIVTSDQPVNYAIELFK